MTKKSRYDLLDYLESSRIILGAEFERYANKKDYDKARLFAFARDVVNNVCCIVQDFCHSYPMEVDDAQEDEIESREFDISDCSARAVKCIDKYDTSPYSCDYELLEIGKEYTVTNVDVYGWCTMITLKEFPGKRFNSVLFTEVHNK